MPKATFPVGVSVLLLDKEKRLLMGKRKSGWQEAIGLWSTPGGRLEPLEDIISAAIRELNEETGVWTTKRDCQIIGWREHFRYGMHYFMFYVLVRDWLGNVRCLEPDKSGTWTWWPLDDLYKLDHTEPIEIIDKLRSL